MNLPVALLLSAALLFSIGCRRRSAAPAPDSSATPAPSPAAPAATPAAPTAPAPPGSELPKELQASTPAVAQMNLAVQEFLTQMGRPPTRLEELLEKRVLPRFPAPSPGMKFILGKGRNNQPEVKEVPQ